MSDIAKDGDQAIVKPGTDVVASMAQGFRNELRSLVEEGLKEPGHRSGWRGNDRLDRSGCLYCHAQLVEQDWRKIDCNECPQRHLQSF